MTRQLSSTKNHQPSPNSQSFTVFIGIDWADEEHAVCILVGDEIQREQLPQNAEAISRWIQELDRRFGDRKIAVILEQSRGALIHALVEYPQLALFPINPKQASCYRESLANSGKKDDPTDAECLARFLREHHGSWRPLRMDDVRTRKIGRFAELRRKTIELRTQTHLRLVSLLKTYFPSAFHIEKATSEAALLAMLRRWPTLHELQRANPKTVKAEIARRCRRNAEKLDELIRTIRAERPLTTDEAIIEPDGMYAQMLVKQLLDLDQSIADFDQRIAELFEAHPDAEIFRSPPGAGAALAPRLLAAFGSDRERFASAEEVQCFCGIAPITKQSGKSHRVQKRYACNRYQRQTFHEFADHARKWSPWSKAYYKSLRARGLKHNAALRSLAFKWIRILFRCWQDHKPYDEQRYLQQLKRKNVPYLKYLEIA